MSGFNVKSLGSFEVPSGRLVVADPIYLTDKHWGVVVANAKPGRWIAMAQIDLGSARLMVFHESDVDRDAEDDRELRFKVGVDTGRVCVVDSRSIASYVNADLNPGFTTDQFGVMVPSGPGDGIYDCWVREYAGQAVSIHVVFIEAEVAQ
jgi:hypothetical protein